MTRRLTIIVPAYNEEERVATVVSVVARLAREELDAFEIIAVDDGSTDRTAEALEQAARGHPELRIITRETNRGVGAAYTIALAAAKMPNLTLVPGDNAFGEEGLRQLFRCVGTADLVISYRANPAVRSPARRALSVVCNRLLRLATRCPLRDGHSLYVWPVAWARDIEVPADYRYHLVSLTKLLRRAETYCEIPVDLTPRPDESSRVMRLSVVWGLGMIMLRLLLRSLIDPPRKAPQRITGDDEKPVSSSAAYLPSA